jgi:GNAT superfamily N-acetyltransferase
MEAVSAATRDDVDRIASLVGTAIDELSPMRGGGVWSAREARRPPFAEQLRAEIDDPTRRVVVGTIDGTIVGYGSARVEALPDGRRLGVIDDIFVEEGARAVGVGEAMLLDLIGWLERQGVIGIDAMALPGHRATKNFFEEAGFTARQLVMHRPAGGKARS